MSASQLKNRALRLLATREHSRVELRRKLSMPLLNKPNENAGNDVDECNKADMIEAVLDRMAETGLQSDERFAQSYIRSRAGRCGSSRLKRELADRGVDSLTIDAALEQELPEDELTRARSVWVKKFTTPPADGKEWARQARFMQSRGFAVETIRKLLKEPFDESA